MSAYANQLVAAAPSGTSDRKALRVLALWHFAYGGLMLLVSGFVWVGYFQLFPNGSSARMGPAYLPVLVGLGTFVSAKGVLVIASAVSLLHARFRALSQVVAGLCCINMPLGTLLGLSTFQTLARPSVVELYRAESGGD